ncbi:DUF3006 domain-containing protein [Clostridium sp. CM027]|uniref:DUF3006 domain-containing protein n=1 Tax=Clostridium sp. CM027 TaxID=2849865 RepID=UPI001C6E85C3|nr:DUF3006 domain-containing protein [Clostridium sp. CM027]MBW9146613.1 DUF3006 domain-containing protein [Clostridium sp. CM027]UVE42064.1 DUF3006 domain-containing protein [Clostridium sp. CM027]
MKIIIDRFEGLYAVCEKEDRTMIDIKRITLPSQAKEGDVLIINNNTITIDINETEKRRKEIQKLTEDLWE